MTKDGKENRFGRFIFTDEQAERVQAGDRSVIWEFIEDNYKYLYRWARRFIRNRLYFLPCGYVEAEEMINQIYVDFPLYSPESEKTLGSGIFNSFMGITCGGILRNWTARHNKEISVDATLSVSKRSGERAEGNTLKDLLPSREPPPDEVIEKREHVREIAPRYFYEIGRLFEQNGTELESGATVGEMLAYNEMKRKRRGEFQDVIEEVFFGYTFEEVEDYAKRSA